MFGYLVTNDNKLDKSQKQIYRQYYCGLCTSLNKQYGNIGSKTLSYDLTVIGMLLTSIYDNEKIIKKKCPLFHTKKNCLENSCLDYAASMNIILSYYKAIDDFNDDHSKSARHFASKLEKAMSTIKEHYPNKVNNIEKYLQEISTYETHNETNPDLLANAFGNIMSEVFNYKDDEYNSSLKQLGFYLGKFIYLMDAVCDFKDDLKHENYNPLIAFDSNLFKEILELNIAACTKIYETLPIKLHKDILDNVFYSGVWSEYSYKMKGAKNG